MPTEVLLPYLDVFVRMHLQYVDRKDLQIGYLAEIKAQTESANDGLESRDLTILGYLVVLVNGMTLLWPAIDFMRQMFTHAGRMKSSLHARRSTSKNTRPEKEDNNYSLISDMVLSLHTELQTFAASSAPPSTSQGVEAEAEITPATRYL